MPHGGEDFDGDQPVAGEGVGGGEVVDLPGAGAGSAQFDGNLRRGTVASGELSLALRSCQGEAAPAPEEICAVASRGRYAKSAAPLNTLSRPMSSKMSPAVCTVQPPVNGSTIHSLSPVTSV